MILICNSCNKKFVVPDNAITASGRMVQCGSCGNKWKQFPKREPQKTQSIIGSQKIAGKPRIVKQVLRKPKSNKKIPVKKQREISLYSPEYLAKKHGINISDTKLTKVTKKNKKESVSFGFYNSLILFIVLIISFSRILFFSQEFIISFFPISEFYLDYFFESIRNIFEIWKNLIAK